MKKPGAQAAAAKVVDKKDDFFSALVTCVDYGAVLSLSATLFKELFLIFVHHQFQRKNDAFGNENPAAKSNLRGREKKEATRV